MNSSRKRRRRDADIRSAAAAAHSSRPDPIRPDLGLTKPTDNSDFHSLRIYLNNRISTVTFSECWRRPKRASGWQQYYRRCYNVVSYEFLCVRIGHVTVFSWMFTIAWCLVTLVIEFGFRLKLRSQTEEGITDVINAWPMQKCGSFMCEHLKWYYFNWTGRGWRQLCWFGMQIRHQYSVGHARIDGSGLQFCKSAHRHISVHCSGTLTVTKECIGKK